jgi:hypothetical protein
MPQPVIFVKGRTPQINYSGAESYVRAIGRAALRAGYEPHIFCVGPAARVEATPFGRGPAGSCTPRDRASPPGRGDR